MHFRFVLAGLLSIGLTGFFAAAQSWRSGFVASADVAFILLSGGCAVLAFVVVRKMGWRGKFGLICSGFFVGILMVFLANVSDGVYDAFWGATPFPSFSDVLYLLGYSVAFVTLFQFLWFFRRAVARAGALKFIALSILTVCGLLVVFLLSHSVTKVPVATLSTLYPMLDIFAVTLSVMMLAFFHSRFISPPWKWFALGMTLMGVGHFLNGLGTTEGWYSYPQPLDLLYLWGYVSIGLGFSMQTKPEDFWRSNSAVLPL